MLFSPVVEVRHVALMVATCLIFGTSVPATSQESGANQSGPESGRPIAMQTITAEEAREFSRSQIGSGLSKIILRVGSHFDPEIISSLERRLSNNDINADFYYSGQESDVLMMYFDGTEFAMAISQAQADRELVPFIIALAQQENLNLSTQAE